MMFTALTPKDLLKTKIVRISCVAYVLIIIHILLFGNYI